MKSSFPNNLPPLWQEKLKEELNKPYFQELKLKLINEYQQKQTIFPERQNILRALQLVDYSDVKIVILGQDPYHGVKQAVGLSFAVPNDLFPKPPSLQNIFKELQEDLKIKIDLKSSELTNWAKQGVLLLNTVLTVRAHQAFSHSQFGWQHLTDKIISLLNEREKPVVFILWGSPARKKRELITQSHHFVIESAHPSPLSAHRGFFGSRPFSKANSFLLKNESSPIEWEKTS